MPFNAGHITFHTKSGKEKNKMNGKQVTVLERLVKIVKKYGFFRILQALFVMLAFLYIIYNVSNLPEIIDRVFSAHTETVQLEHDEAVNARREIKPFVDSLLASTITCLKCDRAYVVEMHNGTNNTAGLPFIYGAMTYEETNGSTYHIDEDYVRINLSRFSLPMFLESNHIFCGTIDDLRVIDSKLAQRMSSNDVNYIAMVTMHGIDNELGYYGISYCNNSVPLDRNKIIQNLTVVSQKLSILLDSKNVTPNNHQTQ